MAYIISRPWGGTCGVGHQFFNWLAGYLLANRYDLTFVHSPFLGGSPHMGYNDFTDKRWEKFLGFGKGFITEEQLSPNIKRITLPRVAWDEATWNTVICDHSAWRDTIEQHRDEDILFECSKDQFIALGWQYLDINKLRENYWYARSLSPIMSNFDNDKVNIAVHIRRGDVTEKGRYKVRWVADCVYQNVMDQIRKVFLDTIFHIYSDGAWRDLSKFQNDDVILHSQEDVFSTFHHMIIADVLVTGQSMFSALAGHLCDGVKLARAWSPHFSNFPIGQKFVEVDNDGNFSLEQLEKEKRK